MNNEEAKFILQGYRPNGADASDVAFAAAIQQAKNDPGLGGWFARQQAFDAAVSAKLTQLTPSADLRSAILAGGKVSLGGATRVRWWNRPVWMGAAAGIALLLSAGVALWPNRAEALTQFALADARLSPVHGGHGHENNELQAVLNDPETRLGQKLPVNFANLHETGCRTVACRGHDVLELCFKRNGVWFHAYIARRRDFPEVARGNAPMITDQGSSSLVTWADAEHVFVVVSKTGRKNLEALL